MFRSMKRSTNLRIVKYRPSRAKMHKRTKKIRAIRRVKGNR